MAGIISVNEYHLHAEGFTSHAHPEREEMQVLQLLGVAEQGTHSAATLRFCKPKSPTWVPVGRVRTNSVDVEIHEERFAVFYDIVRNERPLRVAWREELDRPTDLRHLRLLTGSEPPGEGPEGKV